MQLLFLKKNPSMRKHEHNEEDEESKAINTMLGFIWDQYDHDKNGSLDKNECRQFMLECLSGMGLDCLDENTFN